MEGCVHTLHRFNYSVWVIVYLLSRMCGANATDRCVGEISYFLNIMCDRKDLRQETVSGLNVRRVNFIFPPKHGSKWECCHKGSHSISSGHPARMWVLSETVCLDQRLLKPVADWFMRLILYYRTVLWWWRAFDLFACVYFPHNECRWGVLTAWGKKLLCIVRQYGPSNKYPS